MKMKLSLISAAILSTSLLLSPTASFAKLPVAVNGQQLPTLAPMLALMRAPVLAQMLVRDAYMKDEYAPHTRHVDASHVCKT